MQRGEIHLHSESTPAYFSVIEPSLVKNGTVIPLYYDANYDTVKFSVPQVMEGSSIQPFQEFYRTLKGREPSGPLWDAYRTNLAVDSAMLRTVAMPPGAPQEAQDALRAALARLNNDKEYAAETMKAMQFVPYYETGADINARVRRALTVSPEIRTFVDELHKRGVESEITLVSLALHAGVAHDLAPHPLLRLDVGGVFLGRRRQRHRAFAREPLAQGRIFERGAQRRVEPVDDRPRRARRRHQSVVQLGGIAGEAGLRDGRQLREHAERFALVTASARTLPPCTMPIADGSVANIMVTCPPSRSLSAGPLPR